mgnify:CR=1 FL=1
MKDRKTILKNQIEVFLKKGQMLKSDEFRKLEKSYLSKARKNFTVANLMNNISDKKELREMLNLTSDFEMYDWVIIVSYYAMYTSALSALAKLGFKSKSHVATIAVLELNYVTEQNKNGKGLEEKDIHKLTKAYTLSEQLIIKLMETKTKRETAQYDATPSITKEIAKTALNNADEFITKIEEVLA